MSLLDGPLNSPPLLPARATAGDSLLAGPPGSTLPAPAPPDASAATATARADPQRKATGLERLLDTMATTNYASAGAARALARGTNPLRGLSEGIHDRLTYGDLLESAGVDNPWIRMPVGMALDIALDPATYLSVGVLTKAGKASKAATMGMELAKLSGDAGRLADAGLTIQRVGKLGATAAERSRLGQQAAVSLFGRSLLPESANRALLKFTEDVGERLGSTEIAQNLRKKFMVAPELHGIARDVFLARRAEVEGTTRAYAKGVAKALEQNAAAISEVARKHGLRASELEPALADAVEKAKVLGARGGPARNINPARTAAAITKATDDALKVFGGPAASELAPHVRQMVAQVNLHNATGLAMEQASNVKISELTDPQLNYLFHMVRPQARDALRRAGLEPDEILSKLVTERHASQKARSIRGLTLAQINRRVEAGALQVGGYAIPRIEGGLFVENPFIATVTRAAAAQHASSAAEMISAYAREYGKVVPKANTQLGTIAAQKARAQLVAQGYEPLTTRIRGLEQVWLPKDMASAFRGYEKGIREPGTFLRSYDTVQQIWKRYTLGIFPVYHTRNEIGDLWNAVVLGGMNPSRVADAARAFVHGGDARTFKIAGRTMTGAELKMLAARYNVTDSGQVSEIADALRTIQHAPKSLFEAAGEKVSDNAALRMGEAVGRFRENTTRLALFMDRLGKGDAPEAAALYVKKHLFDYGELTDFERETMKRLMPFYSFSRFNAPLQLSYLFEKPGAFSAIEKVRNEAGGDQGLGLKNGTPLPRFLREGLPVRAGTTEQGDPQFLRLEGLLPASDLGYMVDPLAFAQKSTTLLSPLIQQPIESAFNVNLFQSDIGAAPLEPAERYPGEMVNMLGLPMNRRFVADPLRNIRALSELDRLNPGGIFGTRERPGIGGMVRTSADASALARLTNLAAGRTYAVDEETETMRNQMSGQREITRLLGEYRRAVRRGDTPNARALERRIRQLKEGIR